MRYILVFNDCQDWIEAGDGENPEIWQVDEHEYAKLDRGERPVDVSQVKVWHINIDAAKEEVRIEAPVS